MHRTPSAQQARLYKAKHCNHILLHTAHNLADCKLKHVLNKALPPSKPPQYMLCLPPQLASQTHIRERDAAACSQPHLG
jgi:hypothetical protein